MERSTDSLHSSLALDLVMSNVKESISVVLQAIFAITTPLTLLDALRCPRRYPLHLRRPLQLVFRQQPQRQN